MRQRSAQELLAQKSKAYKLQVSEQFFYPLLYYIILRDRLTECRLCEDFQSSHCTKDKLLVVNELLDEISKYLKPVPEALKNKEQKKLALKPLQDTHHMS